MLTKKRNKSTCRSEEEEDNTSEESDSQTVSTHKSSNKKLTKDQIDEDYRWIHKPVDPEYIDCLDPCKGPMVFGKEIFNSNVMAHVDAYHGFVCCNIIIPSSTICKHY